MSESQNDLQPEPPANSLVENEGVDAAERVVAAPDPDGARAGGRPQDAAEQLEDAPDDDQQELAGAPDPRAEGAGGGGQDEGSIE